MFRRSENQVKFFKHLGGQGVFHLDFDYWYLCFLLGVASGVKAPVSNGQDMLPRFPEKYSGVDGVLTGMVLKGELVDKGVALSERSEVHQVIDQLIAPSSVAHLSNSGFKAFNEYAEGGFEILRERLEYQAPHDSVTFLINYVEILLGAFDV